MTQWTAANGPPEALLKPMWQTAPAGKPQHTNASFWANPVSEQQTQNTFATLTYNNPIQVPATGTTTLKFSEWYFNEDDDRGYVEVSTNNGSTWTPVYTNARSQGSLPTDGAAAFANEGMTPQAVDLTVYSGQTIRLRFRFALGASNVILWTQYGWYIDDISIVNESWTDVAQISGTSFTDHKPSGNYCYQVRTTYLLGSDNVPSLFSNVVNVTVAPGIARVVSRKVHSASTFDIDMPVTGPAGVECRTGSGASSNNHRVIFEFGAPVTFTNAAAMPQPGKTGQVTGTSGGGTRQITVDLGNVSNAQTLSLSLNGISGAGTPSTLTVPIAFLFGDTTGNGSVNASDITQTKNQSGGILNTSNFRNDVTVNGAINASDVSVIKTRAGTALP
jgi:hypothetical protein